jgi:hypothetical protein
MGDKKLETLLLGTAPSGMHRTQSRSGGSMVVARSQACRRGRQGDSDDPAGRDWMSQIADEAIAVAIAIPLYPDERTSSARLVRSVKCQQETHAPQQPD